MFAAWKFRIALLLALVVICGALSLFIGWSVIDSVISGSIQFPSRTGRTPIFTRSESPAMFWLAMLVWLVFAGAFLYAALDTLRKMLRR